MFRNSRIDANLNLRLKFIKRLLTPEKLIWRINDYALPAPRKVKRATLLRYALPNADWIETGTYLGETTRFLSRKFPKTHVFTIEPAKEIYEFSAKKLRKFSNIFVYSGTSETELEKCLAASQKQVNLWLDGHYSGDVTFKGDVDSPILHELEIIARALNSKNEIVIFIDDYRLFVDHDLNCYPPFDCITKWCALNNFNWKVEFDIIILKQS